MIRTRGQGISAASILADDAATLILAALSGASAAKCPEAVRGNTAWRDKDGVSLGEALTKIMGSPLLADEIASIELDCINNWCIIRLTIGEEQVFTESGDDCERLGWSGLRTLIHGRLLRILALAVYNAHQPWSELHKKYVQGLLQIAKEEGNEAAERFMKEHPFEEE